MKLPTNLIEKLEQNDFNIAQDTDYITFQKYSTFGQDFNFTLGNPMNLGDLPYELFQYYQNYDVSEETVLWIDESGHGKNGAPYEIEDIVNDMKECESFIYEAFEIVCDYIND